MSWKAALVIPARLESRRFPRKVLARETGKYLVQHVWERIADFRGVPAGEGAPAIEVPAGAVLIATDSDEVFEAAGSFGARAVMTSPAHLSGTDRVAEAAAPLDVDFVVNVQADEPLIRHEDLALLLSLFRRREGPPPAMTTLVARRGDREGFESPNVVKAVVGRGGRALYFSRAPVPYWSEGGERAFFWWQHIGIYAYRKDFLQRFASLEPGALEGRERLEQLRALEHGYEILAGEAVGRHLGIDTPEEYRRFVEEYRSGRLEA